MENLINNILTIILGLIIGYNISLLCLDELTFIN